MSIFKKLLGLGTDTVHTIRDIEQMPIEAVKAVNRSTPWGQANQREANARIDARRYQLPQSSGAASSSLYPSVGTANPRQLIDGNGISAGRIGSLGAVNGYQNQPFGMGGEDEYTTQTAIQPVSYKPPQYTPHGQFIQGSDRWELPYRRISY